jgi:hypothetical protein
MTFVITRDPAIRYALEQRFGSRHRCIDGGLTRGETMPAIPDPEFAAGILREVMMNGYSISSTNARNPGKRRMLACACAVLLAGALLLVAHEAFAYTQYSQNKDSTNCRFCHGDFRSSPYLSLSDGMSWGDDLHDVHRDVMLDGDCDACHSSGARFPVLLDSSKGGDGLPAISCSGCHGRAEDGTGSGAEGYAAGLRQHHYVNGVTGCLSCHADANPTAFDPVGEDFLPPYYADSDPDHPLIPEDPCNLMADGYTEDYAASTLGLDNDGDGLYDEADVMDCPEPSGSSMLAAGVGFLMLIARRGRR